MKIKLLLVFTVLFYVGCSKSPNTITLKLIPLDIGKSDGKNKSFHHKIAIALRKSKELSLSEWKNIEVLCNEYEEKITLINPNVQVNKKLVIFKGEALLVSDILKALAFNNKRDFFNSLKNTKNLEQSVLIYPYRKSNLGSKNDYIYFKHIYGIILSNKKENQDKQIKGKEERSL